ncbi:peptidylprolyl isomerase, partial [Candidatus Woesearchaeota archaeon]|nr:peptidylprolyl isomerase [Candidatus Woesearchaeota archaeon]
MPIKKNDFVEIEYTGRLKEENIVFDTTDENVAKKNNLGTERNIFGPIIICVGQQHVLKGLDNFLEGKDVGNFSVEIPPADAFGKKDVKLIAMVPARKFLEKKIKPMPGLQVNIDGMPGVIRTVNGGRTIVDFNHPLSGRVVVYDVKVNRVVADKKEKAEGLAKVLFGHHVKISFENNVVTVEVPNDVPANVASAFEKQFKDLVDVELKFVKPEEKKEEVK